MRWAFPILLLVGCVTLDPDDEVAPALSTSQGFVTACPAGTWCVETAPVSSSTLLHGVWAATADDVFAVGDGGTILRRTNDVWSAMASGTTSNLRAVWGSSSTDVWVGGASQTLIHFDGVSWSRVGGATADINAAWGSSANDAWFVGGGFVMHASGGQVSSTSFPGTLLSVSGTGPGDVWATGESLNVRRYNGTVWTTTTTGLGTTHLAVLAISPDDAWASAALPGKEAAHWDGSKWTIVGTGRAVFNFMAALGKNDVWGVGTALRVGHWTGSAWTVEQPFGTVGSLWSVTTVPGHAWLVGDGGLIAHRSL